MKVLEKGRVREEQEFLQHIVAFGQKPLLSIEMTYGNVKTGLTERLVLTPQEVRTVQDMLKQGDLKKVGGRNSVKSSYNLIFVSLTGERTQFRGRVYKVYEWNKDDLYLDSPSSPSDGTWKLALNPIHVPQLGKWIAERLDERRDYREYWEKVKRKSDSGLGERG